MCGARDAAALAAVWVGGPAAGAAPPCRSPSVGGDGVEGPHWRVWTRGTKRSPPKIRRGRSAPLGRLWGGASVEASPARNAGAEGVRTCGVWAGVFSSPAPSGLPRGGRAFCHPCLPACPSAGDSLFFIRRPAQSGGSEGPHLQRKSGGRETETSWVPPSPSLGLTARPHFPFLFLQSPFDCQVRLSLPVPTRQHLVLSCIPYSFPFCKLQMDRSKLCCISLNVRSFTWDFLSFLNLRNTHPRQRSVHLFHTFSRS
ncbi:uncharacterized protein LOC118500475 isoform X2 [Phyllostomus discolor]|nr:uncharacterized protein LOC118500475 isoform X2 [Phyllostomus discolor]